MEFEGCPRNSRTVAPMMTVMYHKHVKSQVVSMLHSDSLTTHLNFMDSQVQAGGSICGLFCDSLSYFSCPQKKILGNYFMIKRKHEKAYVPMFGKGKDNIFPSEE